MEQPTSWYANDLLYSSGRMTWGIDKYGNTFAVGTTAEVARALTTGKARPLTARLLHRAGVFAVSEEVSNDPAPSAAKRAVTLKLAGQLTLGYLPTLDLKQAANAR